MHTVIPGTGVFLVKLCYGTKSLDELAALMLFAAHWMHSGVECAPNLRCKAWANCVARRDAHRVHRQTGEPIADTHLLSGLIRVAPSSVREGSDGAPGSIVRAGFHG